MVRRGQQSKRQLRKAQRNLAAQLESSQGDYRPPDRDACRYRIWETTGDDANTVRLENHTWHFGRHLAEFVINAQVLTSDGWLTVEYVDCCHGSCHHHPQSGTDARTIRRLEVMDDVKEAFSEAQSLIYDRLRIIRDEATVGTVSKVGDKRLDAFRRQVDWNLACGSLAEYVLPVTSDDGGSPVVVAFESERLSVLLGRIRAVGGFANLFVSGDSGVRMASVIGDAFAIADTDDRLTGDDAPGANATVGMFLDYVGRHPRGVTVSAAVGQQACARDARTVDFAAVTR